MTSLKPPRILIVEDEPDIASVLADYLRLEHCETPLVHDSFKAMQTILANPPDPVLLGLMFPFRSSCSPPVWKKWPSDRAAPRCRRLHLQALLPARGRGPGQGGTAPQDGRAAIRA